VAFAELHAGVVDRLAVDGELDAGAHARGESAGEGGALLGG
jgi:hypothetical protein